MSKIKPFKFVVHPIYADMIGSYSRNVVIYVQAPTLVFTYPLSNRLENDDDKLRLATAELKMELVQAIMDGEWEIVNE